MDTTNTQILILVIQKRQTTKTTNYTKTHR